MEWKLLVATLVVAGVAWSAAEASVFAVDTSEDVADALPGDGACGSAVGCSLRAAIQEANALAGPDTVLLPAGVYRLTLEGAGEDQGANGDLDILDEVAITGAGAGTTVIDAIGLDRAFDVRPGAALTLSGVSVRNGAADVNAFGGCIRHTSDAPLELASVVLRGCRARAGGALYSYSTNGGDVTLRGCSLIGNRAETDGGAIYHGAAGDLIASGCVLRDNHAGGSGGAIHFQPAAPGRALRLDSSTLLSNHAGRDGGAVSACCGEYFAQIERSTLAANSADAGGGIATCCNESASLELVTSTISANAAAHGAGGGLLNDTEARIVHATFAGNGAPTSMGGAVFNGGTAWIEATILTGSTSGGDCAGAPFRSLGHNLATDGSCSTFLTATSDRLGVDPRLSPLGRHGGRTQTHALPADSPALDAGGATSRTDQRGVRRPQGSAADIGAYEREPGDAPAPATTGILVTAAYATTEAGASNHQTRSGPVRTEPGLDLGAIAALGLVFAGVVLIARR